MLPAWNPSGGSWRLVGDVCKEGISLLCGNSSFAVLGGCCQMLSVGDAGTQDVGTVADYPSEME